MKRDYSSRNRPDRSLAPGTVQLRFVASTKAEVEQAVQRFLEVFGAEVDGADVRLPDRPGRAGEWLAYLTWKLSPTEKEGF